MIEIRNNSTVSDTEFQILKARFELIKGLNLALEWALSEPEAKKIPEVVTQDEFTHDVIFGYGDLFIVFDTT